MCGGAAELVQPASTMIIATRPSLRVIVDGLRHPRHQGTRSRHHNADASTAPLTTGEMSADILHSLMAAVTVNTCAVFGSLTLIEAAVGHAVPCAGKSFEVRMKPAEAALAGRSTTVVTAP